jgi:5-hmdU DNA kinase, helical domain
LVAPTLWRQRRPPVTTRVAESYWKLAVERQAIYFARIRHHPWPWTSDPILQEHKFTNAYRASDRTSQYLIRHVIYAGEQSSREVTFRTLLFKLFNRIDTWQTIVKAVGQPSARSVDLGAVGMLLSAEQQLGRRIYSAAYIMPPVRGSTIKHTGHLDLLGAMLRAELPDRIAAAPKLGSVFDLLSEWPSIGPFLAYQLTVDLNYAAHMGFDEDDFVVAGPGAREGIAKCFSSRDDWTDEDLIRWTGEQQDRACDRLGLRFADLWGRRLHLIDLQNLYCETAKYARVAHPEFTASGGRSRIKQRYSESGPLETPWYPPKWGLNDRISVCLEKEPAVHEIESERAALSDSQPAPDGHARQDRMFPLSG